MPLTLNAEDLFTYSLRATFSTNKQLFKKRKGHCCCLKLTLVAVVSGQPFPFGTVGCSDDADNIPTLYRKIVLTSLGGYSYVCLVHGFLLSCDLTNTVSC